MNEFNDLNKKDLPPTSDRWIEALRGNKNLDSALAESNPSDTVMGAVVEGRSIRDQLTQEHADDPSVKLKDQILDLLSMLSKTDATHLNDLLSLMDRQAMTMDPADETRYRQFMGLWDFAVMLSRNDELLEQLRQQLPWDKE